MGTCLAHRLRAAGVATVLLHHRHAGWRDIVVGETTSRVPVAALADQAAGSIHRLLLTTKAGQIEEALRLAGPCLGAAATLLTTANGLGFATQIEGPAGPVAIHRAVTTAAAYRDEGGRVVLAATGQTLLGDGSGDERAPDWFADSLARLPDWRWSTSIATAVNEKFAINCVINPLTAVLRCRNGELLQRCDARDALAALCRETEAFLRQQSLWCRDGTLFDAATDVCASTAANRSSMLQDVLAGRPTEIEYLNGHLLRLAAASAVQLPRNGALYRALANSTARAL